MPAPIHDVVDLTPEPYVKVRLFLEDGRTVTGVWTGEYWSADSQEVFADRWQPLAGVGAPLILNGHD